MPLTIDKRTDDQLGWNGVDRRTIDDRREEDDRRQDIRFQLDTQNRRKNDGRREEDANPWRKPHD